MEHLQYSSSNSVRNFFSVSNKKRANVHDKYFCPLFFHKEKMGESVPMS